MPKVTEAHLEARREQILQAAFACFSRNGFHQTTMQDICHEADLSPGAVYRYFESKEAIIEASCLECQQVATANFEAAQQESDTLEVLDELVAAFFGALAEPEADSAMRVNILLWAESLRSSQIGELCNRNRAGVLEYLRGIVARAQGLGEINTSLDTEAVAQVLMSTYEGLVLQKGSDRNVDVEKYMGVLKALYSGEFWRGRKRAEPATTRVVLRDEETSRLHAGGG